MEIEQGGKNEILSDPMVIRFLFSMLDNPGRKKLAETKRAPMLNTGWIWTEIADRMQVAECRFPYCERTMIYGIKEIIRKPG